MFELGFDLDDFEHFEFSPALADWGCPRVAIVKHKHLPGTLVSHRLQSEINHLARYPSAFAEAGFTLWPSGGGFPGDSSGVRLSNRLRDADRSISTAGMLDKIAIIDSGDIFGPSMVDVVGGKVSEKAPSDYYGHGTAVAQIVRNLRPRSEIVPIRVLDPTGNCESYEILQALIIALFSGEFDLVNVSLSSNDGQRCSSGLGRSIDHVRSLCPDPIHLVASAGNRGQQFGYPASLESATVVQALDWTGGLALYNTAVPQGIATVSAVGGEEGDPIATLPTRDHTDTIPFFGTSVAAAVYSASLLRV